MSHRSETYGRLPGSLLPPAAPPARALSMARARARAISVLGGGRAPSAGRAQQTRVRAGSEEERMSAARPGPITQRAGRA